MILKHILSTSKRLLFTLLLGASFAPLATHAAEMVASDSAVGNQFGSSVSLSGNIGLVGATKANSGQGAAYLFGNLDTTTGIVTQNVKLRTSDGAALDNFGNSVGIFGNVALVGALKASANQGASYLFRNLDSASGTITQNVKLTASDGAANDYFGASGSLSGNAALVGATGQKIIHGAAYVFSNLDTASGTITQNVKLTASDGATYDNFGNSVSMFGNIGLVGAYGATFGSSANQGAAYVFRNLDAASGTIFENMKLTASDGAHFDFLGNSVSLSGNVGLVGAYGAKIGANQGQGAAYVFRNLDTSTGIVTQNVKLRASDGAASDNFGEHVSLSGNVGLVGAQFATIGSNLYQGAAYVFRNLDTVSGTITQNVKLTASDGAGNNTFGNSVSLDGDQFVIGAYGAASFSGKAYSGSVSSVSTLDVGNTSKTIDGISFVSQDNWIIGQTTSNNQVTLKAGNTANVTASGKAVYIGQNAGSNNNTLVVAGSLTANQINVGAAGNTGNNLVVDGNLPTASINVASGSTLGGHGVVSTITGAGIVAPGNSPGILTATSVDPSGALGFAFQFTATGSPLYSNASTSLNDVLHLTGATPFTSSLTSANDISLDFTGYGALTAGEIFKGGFYTNNGSAASLYNSILNAHFTYLGLSGGQSVVTSTVAETANFGAGNVNGYVTKFTIVASAPEPSRALLLVFGFASLLMRRRR